MTLQTALKRGEEFLKEKNVPDAGLDAWYLLEFLLKKAGVPGADRAWYFLHMNDELSEEQLRNYEGLLEKRGEHTPLQQLTGEQEFMGLVFAVNEHVLIPRQDTEILVEEALHCIKSGMRVLDVCTGSGCIIISISAWMRERGGKICADAVDLSAEALAVAKKNDRTHCSGVHFMQGDLFEPVKGKYDVIVSNPPYIPRNVIPDLMEEVRLHEPVLALDGGPDGLDFYRRIISESKEYMKPGGRLLLEIGAEQGSAVKSLLEEAGFQDVCIKKDLNSLDRVAAGTCAPE